MLSLTYHILKASYQSKVTGYERITLHNQIVPIQNLIISVESIKGLCQANIIEQWKLYYESKYFVFGIIPETFRNKSSIYPSTR